MRFKGNQDFMSDKTGGKNGDGRIEFLKKKLDEDRAALAAELVKRAKREKRETEKLDRLLGRAVRKTGAGSSDFRRMIAQTALCNLSDDERRWLKGKGWE
jgi:hypothetical protein